MAGLRASQTCGGCATRAPASESFSGPPSAPRGGREGDWPGVLVGPSSGAPPALLPFAPGRTAHFLIWHFPQGSGLVRRSQVFQGKAGTWWETRFGQPFSSASPLPTPGGGAQVPERIPIPHDSSAQIPHPPGLSPHRGLLPVAVSQCLLFLVPLLGLCLSVNLPPLDSRSGEMGATQSPPDPF